MVKCCKECTVRSLGCHSKCYKYKAHVMYYNIQKKRDRVILSQGLWLYNAKKEHARRHRQKAMLK